jgi:hypothetical protein
MGAVQCSRHGVDYSGPFACPHVRAPVSAGATVPAVIPFEFGLDGLVIRDAVACVDCATAMGVTAGSMTDGDDYPLLAPVCGQCLALVRFESC